MDRAAAAERHEREVTWVATPLHGHCLDRADHARVRQLMGAVGRGEHVQPERPGDLTFEDRPRPVDVEWHRAVEQPRRVQVAEQQVGVRHRRPIAAAAVADRAGVGACGARADLGGTGRVEPDEAPAARADLREVDEGDAQRIAAAAREAAARGDPGRDLELGREVRAAALDERCLRRRAAHVEGDDGSIPSRRASSAPAMTPAAGPDSTMYAGRAAAAEAMIPPFDCMIRSGPVTPVPSSCARRAPGRMRRSVGRRR